MANKRIINLVLAAGDLFEENYNNQKKFFNSLLHLKLINTNFHKNYIITSNKNLVGNLNKNYYEIISNVNLNQLGNLGTLEYAIKKIKTQYDYCFITYLDRYINYETIDLIKENIKSNDEVIVLAKSLSNKINSENFFFNSTNYDFGGCVLISKKLLKSSTSFFQQNKDKNITYLFNWDSPLRNKIKLFKPKDDWIEIKTQNSATQLLMGSKADTLLNLRSNLKHSNIPYLVKVYKKEINLNLEAILSKFSKNIIIRSNSSNEDGFSQSSAGRYFSTGRINKNSLNEVKSGITSVFKSYQNEKNPNVLIQDYVSDIDFHGVATTFSLENASPYIIFSISSSKDTASITSGKEKNLSKLVIFNKVKKISGKFSEYNFLLRFIKELQVVLNYDQLDVEFVKSSKDKKVNLVQVRPLVLNQKVEPGYHQDITNASRKFQQLQNKPDGIFGNFTIFSNMTDWNPIEMLGEKPTVLARSLYKNLITNSMWAKQRNEFGYKKLPYTKLLYSFNGKNYIDIRLSLNSFLVNGLSNLEYEKIINYQLNKIKKSPNLHDKVEFNIALTNYNFDLSKKLKPYSTFLSNDAINIIKSELTTIDKNNRKILLANNKKIDQYLNKLKNFDSYKNIDLRSIRDNLALPFAHHARLGFVYKDQLDSLLRKNVIDEKDYSDAFQSLDTISNKFTADLQLVKKGKLSKKQFMNFYGHQRPDTYNIKSKNFKSVDEKVFNSMLHSSEFEFKNLDMSKFLKKLDNFFSKTNFHYSAKEWFALFQQSIEAREASKFKYSYAINFILENIEKQNPNIDFEYLSNISINDYISNDFKYLSNLEVKNELNLELPDVITSSTDFLYFKTLNNKPNFIGSEVVKGENVLLDNYDAKNKIENKIILIENADPGWDWIFSYNFKGLITKYGGPNSHMAIRCSEKNITAAFGVGEDLFTQISNSNIVEIDSKRKNILY